MNEKTVDKYPNFMKRMSSILLDFIWFGLLAYQPSEVI